MTTTATIQQAAEPQTAEAITPTSLAGLGREALRERLLVIGVLERQLRMRVNQLWGWIYVRGATSFDVMTDVAKDLRATLAERHSLDRPQIVTEQVSVDGTRKWLLRLADG
ncbi:MAG: 23S rRNA (adenine(2503)-C(2))-methyltransferase RlmN, partial [Pseudomonadota bacterium]